MVRVHVQRPSPPKLAKVIVIPSWLQVILRRARALTQARLRTHSDVQAERGRILVHIHGDLRSSVKTA